MFFCQNRHRKGGRICPYPSRSLANRPILQMLRIIWIYCFFYFLFTIFSVSAIMFWVPINCTIPCIGGYCYRPLNYDIPKICLPRELNPNIRFPNYTNTMLVEVNVQYFNFIHYEMINFILRNLFPVKSDDVDYSRAIRFVSSSTLFDHWAANRRILLSRKCHMIALFCPTPIIPSFQYSKSDIPLHPPA